MKQETPEGILGTSQAGKTVRCAKKATNSSTYIMSMLEIGQVHRGKILERDSEKPLRIRLYYTLKGDRKRV